MRYGEGLVADGGELFECAEFGLGFGGLGPGEELGEGEAVAGGEGWEGEGVGDEVAEEGLGGWRGTRHWAQGTRGRRRAVCVADLRRRGRRRGGCGRWRGWCVVGEGVGWVWQRLRGGEKGEPLTPALSPGGRGRGRVGWVDCGEAGRLVGGWCLPRKHPLRPAARATSRDPLWGGHGGGALRADVEHRGVAFSREGRLVVEEGSGEVVEDGVGFSEAGRR